MGFIILLDSFHYARTFSLEFLSEIFSMPCASFSVLGGPGGIGCNEVRFLVHGGGDSRDVSVVHMCDSVKGV